MKNKVFRLNIYYICILIVIQLNGIWYYVSPFSGIFKFSVLAESILGIIFILCSKVGWNNIRKLLVLITCLISYMFILLFNSRGYYNFIMDIAFITIIILWLFTYKVNLLKYISNTIVFLGFLSIILYLIFIQLKIAPPTEYMNIFDNGVIYKSYYNLYYSSQEITIGDFSLVRNGFIFSEPGAFAVYLNFSFIYEVLITTKKSRLKQIILILSIITTTSALAYATVLAFLAFHIFFKIREMKGYKKLLYVYFIIVTTPILIYMLYLIYNYKYNAHSISSSVRRDDTRLGLLLFKQKKLFGWGYANWDPLTDMQDYKSRFGDIGGHSNGLVNILYSGGIYLTILYFISFLGNIKTFLKIDYKCALAIASYIILQLYFFPWQFSYFMYLFIILGVLSYILDMNEVFK